MTVFYWLIISLLSSILMATVLPADILKIVDSNLVAGCLLLLLGSIVVPRIMERKKTSRTKKVILAELSMLVDFSEKKLIEMTNILIVHRKVKNRYAEMVCPINRWRGEIGYWAEIGGAHYDFNERELLTRAELHLNWANELMNEEFNAIRVSLRDGGLIQNYTRAERVIMSLIFFLFYAKAILVMNNKLKNDEYRLQLDDNNVSRCVEIVLDDIGCITLDERDQLKKALPLK